MRISDWSSDVCSSDLTAAADIYLGDTSGQVVEFLMQPRPCVFLDPLGVDWHDDPSYAMWAAGEVVTDIDVLDAALARAAALHGGFEAAQRMFAEAQLGDASGAAAARARSEEHTSELQSLMRIQYAVFSLK